MSAVVVVVAGGGPPWLVACLAFVGAAAQNGNWVPVRGGPAIGGQPRGSTSTTGGFGRHTDLKTERRPGSCDHAKRHAWHSRPNSVRQLGCFGVTQRNNAL